MHIHISYISFTHAYRYLILTYHIMFHFLSLFIYISYHFTLCFLFLSRYTYHHIAVLCFLYHIIYHIHVICIFLSFAFMFHVCIYLRSRYGKLKGLEGAVIIVRDNDLYKGPKALLSLYKTMTSIRARRSCNDPNGAN